MSGYKSIGVGDTVFLVDTGRVAGRVVGMERNAVWVVEPGRPDRALPFHPTQVQGEAAFQPGLFRLRLDPAGYGYEVRWFDRHPNENWTRVE